MINRLLTITLLLFVLSIRPTALASKNIVVPATNLSLLPGFKAEVVASFEAEQASIISLTVDAQGHILASSQNDRLFRIIPGELRQKHPVTSVHNVPLEIGGGHGLLYAFEHLYLVKADGTGESGVYRMKDSDGKGGFTEPELILPIPGRGEHGGHGLVVGPAGKWIYLIAGNGTGTPDDINRDHIPVAQASDSFKTPSRQGWVMRFSPDGTQREMFCQGLRNAYDIAFNSTGELFTFDSDNEGYMGLPWYRPANVYHLLSGADYGWRQSPQNLMPYYPDTLPPTVEIGPGSPTGVVFGSQTHFPEKYQRALYACDWSYGRIYAVHLTPRGATFKGDWEFFASGTPLAVTDIVVGRDGALYFATGGRGNKSHLYRIFHETSISARSNSQATQESKVRRVYSALHTNDVPAPYGLFADALRSQDRTLRYAARLAMEHQPYSRWLSNVMAEKEPTALLEGLVAASRHAPSDYRQQIIDLLTGLKWESLETQQKLSSLRIFSILLQRMGIPDGSEREHLLTYLDQRFPATDNNVNKELGSILSQFQPDDYADRVLASISNAESLMTQLHFLSILMDEGFHDFSEAQKKQLTDAIDPYELRAVAHRKYRAQSEHFQNLIRTLGLPEVDDQRPARPVVQNWSLADLLPLTQPKTLATADASRGKAAFRAVRCDNCHRLGNSGGVLGPNLNGLAGRYTPAAVLEHIVNPDKVISDQYQATIFILQDGRQVTGQIVNLSKGTYSVRTDPFRPFARSSILEKDIDDIVPSKTSLMPTGLLNSLTEDEIRDLLGYLLDPR